MTTIKTACSLDCWDTCSIIATVENGEVVDLQGDAHHPVTQGFLCTKGRRLKDRMYSPERVLHPQKKIDGAWHSISWSQAYAEIAAEVRRTLKETGHQGILHAYDWGSGTVLKNLNQRFFYLLGGCTETVGSLCWDAGLEAQRYDFGQARSHAPQDIGNAKAIVAWGRNVAVTNIHMMPFVKAAQAKGSKLIVINPLPTDMDGRADLKISPRPGSDSVLAFGVLNYCIEQGWLDTQFLQQHSVGWAEFSNYVRQFSLQQTSMMTDVQPGDIIELARIYGENGPVTTLLGLGMQRYPGGGNTIRAIDALVAATGHVGVAGGGVNYANRLMPSFFDQDALTQRAGADVREFARGTQAAQIMDASPPIQMLFVTRTNSVTQVPNSARLIEAYESIRCKIAIDMFMTKTAALCDYFLPCTSVLEEEDFIFSSMWHSYVTYIHPAAKPLGEAKPDWRIFSELAQYLDFGEHMNRPIDAWLQMALQPLQAHGIDLSTLKDQGTVELPISPVPWREFVFETPSKKYEFVSTVAQTEGKSAHATYVPSHETNRTAQASTSVPYPYALLTIHPRLSENSQRLDRRQLQERPIVEISPMVAGQTGIKDGGLAILWNEQAELLVEVRVKFGGHPYTVKMESGWWGQGITVNHFTKSYTADFGQQTAQYDCWCNIRPMTEDELVSMQHGIV